MFSQDFSQKKRDFNQIIDGNTIKDLCVFIPSFKGYYQFDIIPQNEIHSLQKGDIKKKKIEHKIDFKKKCR